MRFAPKLPGYYVGGGIRTHTLDDALVPLVLVAGIAASTKIAPHPLD